MNIEQARFNMIEQQIRPWDVLDQKVLDTLSAIPREGFVPSAFQALSFADMQIPFGKIAGHHMLEPKQEARLVQSLQLTKNANVFLVGAGTGYLAAITAHLARSVLVYEVDPVTAEMARLNLKKAGIENITVKTGDGLHPDFTLSFDRILLSGSVVSPPVSLLRYLTNDGFMIAVIGKVPVMTACIVNPHGAITEELFDTCLSPLVDGDRPSFDF